MGAEHVGARLRARRTRPLAVDLPGRRDTGSRARRRARRRARLVAARRRRRPLVGDCGSCRCRSPARSIGARPPSMESALGQGDGHPLRAGRARAIRCSSWTSNRRSGRRRCSSVCWPAPSSPSPSFTIRGGTIEILRSVAAKGLEHDRLRCSSTRPPGSSPTTAHPRGGAGRPSATAGRPDVWRCGRRRRLPVGRRSRRPPVAPGGTLTDAAGILASPARHAAPIPLAETGLLGGWLPRTAGLPVPDGPVTVVPGRPADDLRLRDGRLHRAAPPRARGARRRRGRRAARPTGPMVVACHRAESCAVEHRHEPRRRATGHARLRRVRRRRGRRRAGGRRPGRAPPARRADAGAADGRRARSDEPAHGRTTPSTPAVRPAGRQFQAVQHISCTAAQDAALVT